MWILILSLSLWSGSNAGVSVSSIGGFTSETSCAAAGNTWLKANSPETNTYKRAVCVKA